MKVLVVSNLYPPHAVGGAEVSTALTCAGLADLGFEVHVATLSNSPSEGAITVHRIAPPSPYDAFDNTDHGAAMRLAWHVADSYGPMRLRGLRDVIKAVRPDVIWSNNLAGIGVHTWSQATRLNVPIVHTIRDYYLLCPRSVMVRDGATCLSRCRSCEIFRVGFTTKSGSPRAVTAVSNHVLQRHLAHGYFTDVPAEVIPSPVEPLPRQQARPRSGVIVFGFLGQLTEEKGVMDLLDAFSLVRGSANLVLGGDGPLARDDAFLDRLRTDPRVSHLGRVAAADFFQGIDVLVVPSIWEEPFGRVVVEAATAGVPAIVSDAGGLPETVGDEAGWLYPARDVPALARRMESATETGSWRPKLKALGEIAERSEPRRVATAIADVLRGALR